jgi:hypothetical protein
VIIKKYKLTAEALRTQSIIFFSLGGIPPPAGRQRKTNPPFHESLVCHAPQADGFSEIGISRFLKKQGFSASSATLERQAKPGTSC